MCECVCVCLSVLLSIPKGPTYGPKFLHEGQSRGYPGQVCNSESWVKGQGHQVKKKRFSLIISTGYPLEHRQLIGRSEVEAGQGYE